jgi:molybdenum cofactor cytidylyltransferase
MAAGFSRRFGDTDKRRAPLADGNTLLGHTLRQLLPAFTASASDCRLLVVIRADDDPAALGIPPSCPTLTAANAVQGLGASIADAVRAVQQAPQWASIDSLAILLGDMPAVQPSTLQQLLEQSGPQRIVRPHHDGRPGHPVLFGRAFWPALAALSGEAGARQVIEANRSALISVAVRDHGILLDIDTCEQLADLRHPLHHSPAR